MDQTFFKAEKGNPEILRTHQTKLLCSTEHNRFVTEMPLWRVLKALKTIKTHTLMDLFQTSFELSILHPWKLTWNQKNHPVEKENHVPNLHLLPSMFIFSGSILLFRNLKRDPPFIRPWQTPKLSSIQAAGNKQGWSNQSRLQWLGFGSAKMLVSGPTQQPDWDTRWATNHDRYKWSYSFLPL